MTSKKPRPDVFTYTTLLVPSSDDHIPYPSQIEEGHKAEFRAFFIEYRRLVHLRLQMTRDLNKYGKSIKSEASRSAAAVYRSFRVLPYEEGEVEEPRHGFRKGFVQKRVKELSDRIMGFSEDTAWREMMQKQGKKGKYVRNCGGGDEDEDDGDHERLRPGQ